MDDAQWWRTISTTDLLALRRRLLRHLEAKFGHRLKAELEDLVQHGFAIMFRRRDSVTAEDDGLYRYLKTICHHAAVDRIRTAKHRRGDSGDSPGPRRQRRRPATAPDPSPTEVAEENERIWGIFCALSDLDRLVVWSYVVDEQSIRGIAQDTGLHWHRVAEIIRNALSEFRDRLKD